MPVVVVDGCIVGFKVAGVSLAYAKLGVSWRG